MSLRDSNSFQRIFKPMKYWLTSRSLYLLEWISWSKYAILKYICNLEVNLQSWSKYEILKWFPLENLSESSTHKYLTLSTYITLSTIWWERVLMIQDKTIISHFSQASNIISVLWGFFMLPSIKRKDFGFPISILRKGRKRKEMEWVDHFIRKEKWLLCLNCWFDLKGSEKEKGEKKKKNKKFECWIIETI